MNTNEALKWAGLPPITEATYRTAKDFASSALLSALHELDDAATAGLTADNEVEFAAALKRVEQAMKRIPITEAAFSFASNKLLSALRDLEKAASTAIQAENEVEFTAALRKVEQAMKRFNDAKSSSKNPFL